MFRSKSPRFLGLIVLVTALMATSCDGVERAGPDIAPQDSELVSKGADIFQSSCAACHGADLRGTNSGPSLLSIVYEPAHHGDAAFLVAIQVGVRSHHWDFGDMAPIEGLSEQDIEAVIAYVRENQRVEGFEPYPP